MAFESLPICSACQKVTCVSKIHDYTEINNINKFNYNAYVNNHIIKYKHKLYHAKCFLKWENNLTNHIGDGLAYLIETKKILIQLDEPFILIIKNGFIKNAYDYELGFLN